MAETILYIFLFICLFFFLKLRQNKYAYNIIFDNHESLHDYYIYNIAVIHEMAKNISKNCVFLPYFDIFLGNTASHKRKSG